MASDYKAISDQHWQDYGTKIDRWAPRFLANQYDDRTHFIFELLQNAEDALRKRGSKGSGTVAFALSPDGLRVSHFGKPFEEPNVRAICSIGESTKEEDLTAIGKFGIGFKSVYSLTSRPEVHSGNENFAIESFVHPVAIEPIPCAPGETVFWLPFKEEAGDIADEVQEALKDLPASTLLFLTHVSEISWTTSEGASGSFSRVSKKVGDQIKQTTLRRTIEGVKSPAERWLVCSRPVCHDGHPVGAAELAFLLAEEKGSLIVKPVSDSRLVAFFPTIVPAKLGFVIQAPFQTTPSRDNIPGKEPWNQQLVRELAQLLGDSLVRLRDYGALSLELLSALPLNRSDFPVGSMLAPVYDATHAAIKNKPILPTADGKWVTAQNALIARGDDLRKLLRPRHLAGMFGTSSSTKWLSERLTQIRFPALHRYLISSQGVSEISPTDCITKWSKAFLESQPDGWIVELCAFLLTQPALMREPSFKTKPWVRMEDGTHRAPFSGDQPLAFLPARVGESGFPTVRRSLLKSKEALEFYSKLGLTQPDPVDDVIAHVLPKYGAERVQSDLTTYAADIERIVSAAKTDSTKQLDKLTSAAKDKKLVLGVDGLGQKFWTVPSNAYLSSASLRALFAGVKGVLLVDDEQACLKGEGVRSLLRRLGASTYLDTFAVDVLPQNERYNLRSGRGTCRGTNDRDIRGLEQVLALIPKLTPEESFERCRLLWDALRDLVRDSRETVLYGTYHWSHYGEKSAYFTACFVRRLQAAKWIPNEDGKLVKPSDAVFERIPGGWTENAAMQKALGFKPPVMEILAKEMGVEAEMLNLLLKRGIKTKAQLEEFLTEEPETNEQSDDAANETSSGDGLSDESGAASTSGTSESGSRVGAGSGGGSRSLTGGTASSGSSSSSGSSASSPSKNSHAGRTEFFSYLKTHPVEVEDDEFSDSETHEQRMRVEAVAIDHILTLESDLQRTPAGNKGYDLFGTDDDGHQNRWIEVKAMVGTLANHPVGMSKAQFEMALEKGFRYWLYIVENATSEEPRILKIQDPAGNARTFTFDEGWREIAMVSQVNVETGEVKA